MFAGNIKKNRAHVSHCGWIIINLIKAKKWMAMNISYGDVDTQLNFRVQFLHPVATIHNSYNTEFPLCNCVEN